MFGLGNVRKHNETIEMQEEIIGELYEKLAVLSQTLVVANISIIDLEDKLSNKPKPKRKPRLTNRTGYKKISVDESLDMYDRYKAGESITDIAFHTGRSASAVHNHIVQHLEAEDGQ